MLNFSQKWTSLPNDAYRPMLIYHTECIFLQDFFTIDNTRPLAIIFFHQNKRPSPIKGPLLKIRLQYPLNVLRENSSPMHYWCVYGILYYIVAIPNSCHHQIYYQKRAKSVIFRPKISKSATVFSNEIWKFCVKK